MSDTMGGLSNIPAPIAREKPWVQLKTFTSKPNIFRSMVGEVSPDARQGDVVSAYDKQGSFIGYGFWNAGAPIALRILKATAGKPDDAWFEQAIRRAVALRKDLLKLDADTDAYRVVNGDADFLSGLIVDRLGDVLSIEVSSLGVMRRLPRWIRSCMTRSAPSARSSRSTRMWPASKASCRAMCRSRPYASSRSRSSG
jgi:23S rRNA (cytosine1962-C5)-methyltransferase